METNDWANWAIITSPSVNQYPQGKGNIFLVVYTVNFN